MDYTINFDTDERTIFLLALDIMEGMTAESVKSLEHEENYDAVTAYNKRRQEIVDLASRVRRAGQPPGNLDDYVAMFGGTT